MKNRMGLSAAVAVGLVLAAFAAVSCAATDAAQSRPSAASEPANGTAAAATQSAAVMLEKGIYTEETVGDLDKAMGIYRQIVEDAKANRPYAAQAQYRLAMCHLKKGDKAKARQELQELLASYPQEKEIGAKAQKELAKLTPGASAHEGFLPLNQVTERTLNPTDLVHARFLDLDTGKMFDMPSPDEVKSIPAGGSISELKAWAASRGIDLMADDMPLGFELAVFAQPNSRWDEMPPAGLLKVIEQAEGATPALLAVGKDLPATFYFKTREGSIGVLQVVGFLRDKKPGEPTGIKIRYKLLEYGPAPVADAAPRVVKTSPAALTNDVDPSLGKITVTFDRAMMDKSWSWTGGGDTYPQRAGEISYDVSRTTCTMPVKLQPGKVYWVGVNSPSFKHFQTMDHTPAQRYVILFATKSADGKPTPLPDDMVKQAKGINEASRSQPAANKTPSENDKREAENLSVDGWRLWGQKKPVEAEEKFKAAVEKDPTNANAWNGLGWAQMHQDKKLNAKVSFEKAVAIDPKAAGSLNGLGWIARKEGKTDEAVAYWNKAVEANPSATAAYDGLAGTYADLGQYDKLAECCRRWLKADPKSEDAKTGLNQAEKGMEAVKAGTPAAQQWLAMVDDGQYDKAWEAGAAYFRAAAPKEQFVEATKAARAPLGKLRGRKVLSVIYTTSLPGAPDGSYVVIQYESSFENKEKAVETITPMKDTDGKWRVSGYFVR